MRTVKLLVKNLIILSLIDKKVTCEEIANICNIITNPYWFLSDVITIKELKVLMREYLTLYQGFETEQLVSQFETNTSLLKNLIPTNQKFEHIKILKNMSENETLTDIEEKLIAKFEKNFLAYIEDEAVLVSLSFENYKKYLIVLMQYSFVDKISIDEKHILINEIELFSTLNKTEYDSDELYKELLKEVEANQHNHPGSRFIQNTKNLLLSFNAKQDKYFLKVLEQIKRSDNKISTQEKSFDTLLTLSRNAATREEIKIDEALSNIVFNVNSPYNIAEDEENTFKKFLPYKDIPNNISKALQNMQNILHVHFDLELLDEESLYKLFKHDILSYQQLLFIKKLLYISTLKNKHIITQEEYIIIINKIASVSYHYYKEIPIAKRDAASSKFPLFTL